jgi:hypothetical protein
MYFQRPGDHARDGDLVRHSLLAGLLVPDFILPLVPIAFAYVVAHYFSLSLIFRPVGLDMSFWRNVERSSRSPFLSATWST